MFGQNVPVLALGVDTRGTQWLRDPHACGGRDLEILYVDSTGTQRLGVTEIRGTRAYTRPHGPRREVFNHLTLEIIAK